MKRKLLILIGIALPALMWAGKSTPYSTIFYGDDEWTITDANGDGKTWTKESGSSYSSADGAAGGIKYAYNSSKSGDDWCISPAITLEAGKEYKLKIWEKAHQSSFPENYKVFLAQENTIEALTAGTTLLNREGVKTTSWTKQTTTFTVETTGDYYFGVYECSEKNMFNLYVTNFYVAENVLTPGSPTGLTATEDPAGALKVDLSWTLPTVDDDGAALAEDAITGVKVYRDDELIATLEGQATSMTDTEALGLTGGFHNYSVSALIGTAEGAKATIRSRYVGPIAAQALPWTSDFSSADVLNSMWKIVKGANSTATESWKYYTSTYYGNAAQFAPGSGKVLDDWLITPPLKFEHAGTYKVVFNSKYNDYAKEINFGVALGKGADISTYSTIATYDKIGSTAADYECVFEITEPGEYNIGFHAGMANSNYSTYYIYSVNVKEMVILPGVATELAVVADPNYDLSATLTWKNPTTTNVEGVAVTELTKAVVYRNGEQIAEITEGIVPGETSTYVDTEVPSPGKYTYAVEIYSAEGKAESDAPTVVCDWIGGGLALPYTADYNDWQIWNVNADKNSWDEEITWNKNSDGSRIYIVSNNNTPNDWAISPRLTLVKGMYYDITVKSWTGMDGEPPYTWELAYGTSTDPESMVAITTVTTNVKNLSEAQQDVITICVDEPDAVCSLPVVPYGVRTIGIHAINKGAVQIGDLTIGESTASVGAINRNADIRVVGGNIVFSGLARKMTIVDLSGKIVASANACSTYNISALASGSYIVSAYIDGRHTVCKIFK